MASDRLLIKDGHVLTLDRTLGDLEQGDVLIEDERVSAVAAEHSTAFDAQVIDASGTIVMPGLRGHAPPHLADGDARRSARIGPCSTTSAASA